MNADEVKSEKELSRATAQMRQTLVRLVRQRRPQRNTDPLLPPLRLYKAILRAHAFKLQRELRSLGDQYVKAEFKAHKNVENPLHIVGFLTQWQDYLKSVDGNLWMEGKLKKEDLEKMSAEQILQMYELMQETKKVGSES